MDSVGPDRRILRSPHPCPANGVTLNNAVKANNGTFFFTLHYTCTYAYTHIFFNTCILEKLHVYFLRLIFDN